MDPSLSPHNPPQQPSVGSDAPVKVPSEKVTWEGKCVQADPNTASPLNSFVPTTGLQTETSPPIEPKRAKKLVEQTPIERIVDPKGKNSALFQQSTTPEKLKLIETLRPHVPILNEAIKVLAKSYASENRDLIAIQHRNLDVLAEIVFNAIVLSGAANEFTAEKTRVIPPLFDLNVKVLPELKPYIMGEKLLVSDEREEISNRLTVMLPIMAKDMISIGVAPKSKVTPKMLQTSAKLMEALKEGIQDFKAKGYVSPLSTSANAVFRMPNAYFKTQPKGEKAGAVIEKMIWDMAEILHVEDFFAPTALAHIPGKLGSGQLATKEAGYVGGGVQNALSGAILRKTRPSTVALTAAERQDGYQTVDLDRQSVLQATLISWVFGMYDADDANIFITNDGQVKFFDNTLSLPNNNNLIYAHALTGTYRCNLNTTDIAYSDLNPKEKEALKQKLSEIKGHFEEIEHYFNSPLVSQQIKKLPPGWFDKANIKAFKERLDNIEKALQNPHCNNLVEMTMEALPYHKFDIVLQFIGHYPNRPVEDLKSVLKDAIKYAGFQPIPDGITLCAKRGINPREIFEACTQSSNPISFFDLLKKVKGQLDAGNTTGQFVRTAGQLTEELLYQSKFDVKGFNNNAIRSIVSSVIEPRILAKGHRVFREWEAPVAGLLLPPGSHFIGCDKGDYSLYVKDVNGDVKQYSLDVVTNPGKIIVKYEGGAFPHCTLDEFTEWIATGTIAQKPSPVKNIDLFIASGQANQQTFAGLVSFEQALKDGSVEIVKAYLKFAKPENVESHRDQLVQLFMEKDPEYLSLLMKEGKVQINYPNPKLPFNTLKLYLKVNGKNVDNFEVTSSINKNQVLELLELCPNIKHLDLKHNQIFTLDEMRAFVKKFPQLNSIKLQMGDINTEYLNELLRLKELQSLSLGLCILTHDCLPMLAQFKNLQNLEWSGVKTQEQCEAISKVKTLLSLTLPNASFGDKLIGKLKDLHQLVIFDAGSSINRTMSENVKAVVAELPQATSLNLSYSHVDSEAIKKMAALKYLLHLNISDCELDDSHAKEIVQLKGLRTLDLRDNKFSEGMLETLKKHPIFKETQLLI